jgi:hypothetical protein
LICVCWFWLICPPTAATASQHTSAYVSIRQHTSAYVSIPAVLVNVSPHCRHCERQQRHIRQHTSAYVSIRQHTSAYVSIRQHTSA